MQPSTNTAHIEAKGKFLNIYRGRAVFYLDGLTKPKTAPYDLIMDGDHVLLRSVQQLTDEEIKLIAKIFYRNGVHQNGEISHDIREYKGHFWDEYRSCLTIVFDDLYKVVSYLSIYTDFSGSFFHYEYQGTYTHKYHLDNCDVLKLESVLRSIGILIPFTTIINGEVKTYDVEELLALNWCKIKED